MWLDPPSWIKKTPATPCDAGDRVPIREDSVHCRSSPRMPTPSTRMHHQEHQHVHGPMPSIVELLVLNRAGDRPAKGLTLQNLEGRDLIDTNDPDALFSQSLRIPIAPKDLLRSLFEPGIQTGRLSISGAIGLQIHIVQQPANRCRTDRANDAVLHGLTSQVLAGPMGDVQALGNWFQTGQFHDLPRCTGVICSSRPERPSRPSANDPSKPSRR